MPRLQPGKINEQIAHHFAPAILSSLKYGENLVCVWLPGCGKSTVLNDLLTSKKIQRAHLDNLYPLFKFYYVTGYSYSNLDSLDFSRDIKDGREPVLIVDEIDHLSVKSLSTLLDKILEKSRQYKRRVHTILNVCDIDKLNSVFGKHKYLFTFANKIEYLIPIDGKLLENYIRATFNTFGKKAFPKEIKRISKYTGGILHLTKELIRNYPKEGGLDLKLKTIWDRTPESKKSTLLNLGLHVFKDKPNVISKNTNTLTKKVLSHSEFITYDFLNKKKGQIISKYDLAEKIWGGEAEYTDWAIDQFISRLRKKLVKCGVDPASLKTVKGRGYKWQH